MTGEIRLNAYMARIDDFHRQAAEHRVAGGDARRPPRAGRDAGLIGRRRRRGAIARTA
jgi:hypothetical protein